MPRKRRVEYTGALYHVISRGNYRKELFLKEGTGKSFEETLFEAISAYGWVVYAYVVMSNHYHLAVRTPKGNLVAGMKWLQSTFATRFNKFPKESGHVFQGRYKAILVEPGRPLLSLVNYIHLNPVRAKVCKLEELQGYSLSSYPKYWEEEPREGLDRSGMLSALGVPDNLEGMRQYAEQLEVCEAREPRKRKALMEQYCTGWFIGSEEAKAEMADWLAKEYPQAEWNSPGYAELVEAQWEERVQAEMKAIGKTDKDLTDEPKGAEWKARIALGLRRETAASNPWIAKRLDMGHPSRVTNLIREARVLSDKLTT